MGAGVHTTLTRDGGEGADLLAGRKPQHVQPRRSPGICRWKGPGETAAHAHPPFNRSHTHTYTYRLSRFKKSLKSIFKIIRGNSKYEMHFRGFPSWETIPKEDGERGGDKKWNSAPRE